MPADSIPILIHGSRKLFKNTNVTLLWLCAAVGNFPIFVPPFFLPLYNQALGFSSSTGAGLVAGFTLSSAIGRIFCGFCCDRFGPVNVLLASLLLSAFSMLVIWPSRSLWRPLQFSAFSMVSRMADSFPAPPQSPLASLVASA